MDNWEGSRKNRSTIWRHFTQLGNYNASCHSCKGIYSYKTSVGNLNKHWKRCMDKHNDDGDTTDCSDPEWSNNSDEIKKHKPLSPKQESKATWQYFEVVDDNKFSAKCKVCEKEVSYDSISDLREHAREHDAVISDDEDWGEVKDTSTSRKNDRKRINSSKVWRFMEITDSERRTAVCLICRRQLSFMSSISNLTKHVRRIHPNVNLEEDEPGGKAKKLLVASNGQLYEIETGVSGEKDPIETEEIHEILEYESLDGELFNQGRITPENKNIKKNKTPSKKLFTKEMFNSTAKSNRSIENTPKNTHNDTSIMQTSISAPKMDSMDYFGHYVVSLLRQLPKHVSDQLQSDMIKQIFAAKLGQETSYSVTLNEKPVTVTINNGIGESMPEITVHNTSEDGETNADVRMEV